MPRTVLAPPQRTDEKVEIYLPKEISLHSPSFWVLCKHVLIISAGFPKAIFTHVYILIISTLCYCHCSPPFLLIPILLLKFPSSFGVQFLFLCFGDSLSLIRVTYRNMGDGLFTRAWATYLWQHHGEKISLPVTATINCIEILREGWASENLSPSMVECQQANLV